jgi:hypothetical protein
LIGFGYIDVVDDVVGTVGVAGAFALGRVLIIVGFGGATDRRVL